MAPRRAGTAGSCNDWAARPCADLAGGVPACARRLRRRWPTHGCGPGVRRGLHRRLRRARPGRQHRPGATGASAVGGQRCVALAQRLRDRWKTHRSRMRPLRRPGIEFAPRPMAQATRRDAFRATMGRNVQSLTGLRVPRPGDWRVTLWLEDEAGNADPERSSTIRSLRFDERCAGLGLRRGTRFRSGTGSCHGPGRDLQIGEAWIEARRRGENAWRSLPTAIEPQGFSAVLDDERLPKGRYDLRARARDLAGNERTIDRVDGKPATRTLPIRIGTRLAVGKPTRVRAGHRRQTPLPNRPSRATASAVWPDHPASGSSDDAGRKPARGSRR